MCISGGGVRSAATSIGVLGCLARFGILNRINYLSTVSGGGFAAAAASLWHRERCDDLEAEIDPDLTSPFMTFASQDVAKAHAAKSKPATKLKRLRRLRMRQKQADLRKHEKQLCEIKDRTSDDTKKFNRDIEDIRIELAERNRLPEGKWVNGWCSHVVDENEAYIRHVRANVSYLMPRGLGGLIIGAYVLLRTIFLNLATWMIFVTSAIWLALYFDGGRKLYTSCPDEPPEVYTDPTVCPKDWFGLGSGPSGQKLISLFGDIAGKFSRESTSTDAFGFLMGAGVLCFWALLALSLAYSPFTWLSSFKAIQDPSNNPGFSRYVWRRGFEFSALVLVSLGSVCFLFGSLPTMDEILPTINHAFSNKGNDAPPNNGPDAGQGLGAIYALIGIGVALIAAVRQRLGKAVGKKTAVSVVIGSVFLCYRVLLLS